MRKIDVADDIVALGTFKTHASALLRRMRATRRPLVITRSGRPAAVVLTPEEFAGIDYRELVRAKVTRTLERLEKNGRTISEATVVRRAKARIRTVARGR
jgi:prevent-host-death family protein